MLASLLAASLASNLGLVGVTLTDWLIIPGLTIPRGSRSFLKGPLAEGATVDCPLGAGTRPVRGSYPAEAGPGESGFGAPDVEAAVVGVGAWRGDRKAALADEWSGDWNDDPVEECNGDVTPAGLGGGKSGDGCVGGLTNMDLVPSAKRPPKGGPSSRGGEKPDGFCGVDGPAPGDCGGREFLIRTDGGMAVVPGGGIVVVTGCADAGPGEIGAGGTPGPNPGLTLVLGALIGGPDAGRGMGALE